MGLTISIVALSLAVICVCITILLLRRNAARKSVYGFTTAIEKIKEIGELSVLKAYIKEIVTLFDENGWHTTDGKMVLICSFEIEFRYDIGRAQINKSESDDNRYTIQMPPHFIKIIPDDIKFYHEEKRKFLGIMPSDFSVNDRNKLIKAARKEAAKQAESLHNSILGRVQNSAKITISAIAEAFGIEKLDFEFSKNESFATSFQQEMEKLKESA